MRIVVSLTTVPSGIQGLKEVVHAYLHQQSRQPDKIYLNIPRIFGRDGSRYDVPESQADLVEFFAAENPHNVPVEVLRCDDKGPITKLYPALEHETAPDSYILMADDDSVPTDCIIGTFERYAAKYPDAALTTGGWVAGSFPLQFQAMSMDTSNVRRVDWIEGAGFTLLPGFLLPTAAELLDYDALLGPSATDDESAAIHKLFRVNDDHWISWHLQRNGIKCFSIPENCKLSASRATKDYNISGSSLSDNIAFASTVKDITDYLKDKNVYSVSASLWPLPISLLIYVAILAAIVVLFIIWRFIRTRYQRQRHCRQQNDVAN